MLIAAGVALSVFKKHFGWSDISLSIMSLSSLVVDSIIRTVASQGWQFYLSSTVSMFKIVAAPMLRAIMSLIVSKDELGRIYSISGGIEALSGLAAAPLYTKTYSETLLTFPSAFNLISVAIFVAALLLAVTVGRWLVSSRPNRVYETKL
jgi:MFS transporter, PCFT/HCP family, solute carrier family 46 (folate transporter), member 1